MAWWKAAPAGQALQPRSQRPPPIHLAELPRDVEIVAYCRGPFCLMSDEAVKLLQARGYRARKTFDGVSEWQAAGLPVQRA